MERARFIEQFVANFLSTWAVHQYGMACAGTIAGDYMRDAPVVEARALAKRAWDLNEAHITPDTIIQHLDSFLERS